MNKTLQEYIDDWNDLEAYRNLQKQPFDFGTGLITDDSIQSEDGFWKMEQWNIESAIEDLISNSTKIKYFKSKLNHYNKKQITKIKLIKLFKIGGWYSISYDEDTGRYIRYYYSGRRGFAKWCSDRAVRNRNDFSLKGGGYKKVYDYWNTVF